MNDVIRSKPPTQEYKDGWDRIFGNKPCPSCGGTGKSKFAKDMPCEDCYPVIPAEPLKLRDES